MNQMNRFSSLQWTAVAQTAGIGALAGLAAFFLSEPFGNFDNAATNPGFLVALFSSGLWSGAISAVLGAILLVHDNTRSLRGSWRRDLGRGLALFFVLGMVGGGAGQLFYSLSLLFVSDNQGTSFTQRIARAIGWSFVGVGVGLGIGLLRRDATQARRGALGGLLGGFLGGFLFDALAGISQDDGTLSRCVGLILMGAAIAFGRLLVQEALKTAWLLGISTGPYEGKEAPLTKNRVSVGRDAGCDIALLRDETVTPQHGAFIFEGGRWNWRGESAKIDGVATQNGVLGANSVIEFGAARFRFLDRSRHDATSTQANSIAGLPARLSQTPRAPAPVSLPIRFILRSAGETPWPELQVPESKSQATIGRAPSNDFVLSEATVSSQHAQLFWNSAGLQLRDENSSNGTGVNGEKIAPGTAITLREGDRVAFGKVEYIVAR